MNEKYAPTRQRLSQAEHRLCNSFPLRCTPLLQYFPKLVHACQNLRGVSVACFGAALFRNHSTLVRDFPPCSNEPLSRTRSLCVRVRARCVLLTPLAQTNGAGVSARALPRRRLRRLLWPPPPNILLRVGCSVTKDCSAAPRVSATDQCMYLPSAAAEAHPATATSPPCLS